MKYLVVSTAVIDEIKLAGENRSIAVLGGAGVYALAGMKVWHDDAMLITGIGEDFLAEQGDWFTQNGLTTAGLSVRDKNTAHTVIRYFADGERVETPIYGPGHYLRLTATAADIARHCAADTAGVYVFRDLEQPFWQALLRQKAIHGFKLMWEVDARATVPERLPELLHLLAHVDILSLNRHEALTLFATDTVEEAIVQLQKLAIPLIYLRLGADGAYLITDKARQHIPPVPGVQVVDPTGAGNSSSGAVLAGYCEGYDLITIGLMGTISAALCLAQYGPPPLLDHGLRRAAQQRLAELRRKL